MKDQRHIGNSVLIHHFVNVIDTLYGSCLERVRSQDAFFGRHTCFRSLITWAF